MSSLGVRRVGRGGLLAVLGRLCRRPAWRGVRGALCSRAAARRVLRLVDHEADEEVHPPGELLGGARLEDPVEAELRVAADLALELVPLAVSELVSHAQEEAVLLLVKHLAARGAVLEVELCPGVVVGADLVAQRRLHLLAGRQLALAFLDLLVDALPVLDENGPLLEERVPVGAHLLHCLALHLSGDLVHILAAEALHGADEAVEVCAGPAREALLEELLALRLLLLREQGLVQDGGRLRIVRLARAARACNLRLMLLDEELLDARRVEELEVLHLRHLLHLWRLVHLRLLVPDGRARVALRVAARGPLALAHRIPHDLHEDHVRLAAPAAAVVHAVELLVGEIRRGEVEETLLVLLRELGALVGEVLPAGEDGVDVLVGDPSPLRLEDLVRAVAHRVEGVLLGHGLGLVREAARLDDRRVHAQLELRALDHLLLDGVRHHEPVHVDLLALADAVRAVLRLEVRLGVPVRVVEDHRVRRLEVDAEAPGARGEEEDKLVRALLVEGVDGVLALLAARVAVDAAVGELLGVAVVLEDVQHAGHLGEDEHAVAALGAEPHHDAVEEHHLARGLHDGLVDAILTRGVLGPVEEEGVVAHLAQLHEHVVEPHRATVRRGELLLQHAHIHALLLLRELRVEHVLELVGDAEVHVRLEPAEEEGPEDEVELGDHLLLLLALEDLLLAVPVLDGKVKPVLEGVEVVEDVREQKVEEGPELREVVLQGGAREEEAVARIHRLEVADEPAVEVLEAVALVHHEELPVIAPELLHVPEDDLVGGNYHGEGGLVGEPHVLRAEPRALLL
mmetsp:Transcript_8505/g.28977  ORF Transcript_8505/g.28977 Transcript_8505/m.28977 type:complete len:798 (+) Transcript_8505:345-2738(+)